VLRARLISTLWIVLSQHPARLLPETRGREQAPGAGRIEFPDGSRIRFVNL